MEGIEVRNRFHGGNRVRYDVMSGRSGEGKDLFEASKDGMYPMDGGGVTVLVGPEWSRKNA